MSRPKGKVVQISGGARGMGAAHARAMIAKDGETAGFVANPPKTKQGS